MYYVGAPTAILKQRCFLSSFSSHCPPPSSSGRSLPQQVTFYRESTGGVNNKDQIGQNGCTGPSNCT